MFNIITVFRLKACYCSCCLYLIYSHDFARKAVVMSQYANLSGAPLSSSVEAPNMSDPLIVAGLQFWGNSPKIIQIPAKGYAFRQGDIASFAYLVLKGKLQLRRDTPLRRISIDIAERSDWIGVPETLHEKTYAIAAMATENTTMIALNKEGIEKLVCSSSPLLARAVLIQGLQYMEALDAFEAQVLDNMFLGLCRAIELLFSVHKKLSEPVLFQKLRELFPLPANSLRASIRLIQGLNFIKNIAEAGEDPLYQLSDPAHFSERVKEFAEEWHGRIGTLLGDVTLREPYSFQEICDIFQVDAPTVLKRLTMSDFPWHLMRFDPEMIENIRKTQGDKFFHKRLTGRDLMANIESVNELQELDVSLLRDILPRMDLTRLIKLMASVDTPIRNHLLQAVSARQRKTVEMELPHTGAATPLEFGDLEDELLRLCRGM